MSYLTEINIDTLEEMGACEVGYDTFLFAHGTESVTILDALESNGAEDVLWYLDECILTDDQHKDLWLLLCDFVERVLPKLQDKLLDKRAAHFTIRLVKKAREFALGEVDHAYVLACQTELLSQTYCTVKTVTFRNALILLGAQYPNGAHGVVSRTLETFEILEEKEEIKQAEEKHLTDELKKVLESWL